MGISSDKTERNKATYRDELIAFARMNSKFIPVVEKSLAEYVICPNLSPHGCSLMLVVPSFVQSDKKNQVLPKMPPERRKFVQEVNPPWCLP